MSGSLARGKFQAVTLALQSVTLKTGGIRAQSRKKRIKRGTSIERRNMR
jgi:hypothetical protein